VEASATDQSPADSPFDASPTCRSFAFFQVMPVAPLPRFIHWISHRALRWSYRTVRYVGRERIPRDGPVLLIGNHPNDLPDVLAGLFLTPRPVRYIATISATMLPLASATYRALGVIPITRIRDVRKMRERGVDAGAVNATAFAAVQAAFVQGDVVAVFPEGGVHDTSAIGVFRPGVTKMALNSVETDATSSLLIVPFGLQYEAPQQLRSDVTVVVGAPIALRAWADTERRAGRTPSASMLSGALREALMAVTRNSDTWEDAACRDRLIAAVAAVSASAHPLAEYTANIQHRCSQLVAMPPADDFSHFVRWRTIAHDVASAVRRAGGIDTSALDTARVIAAARPARRAAVGGPVEPAGGEHQHADPRWPDRTPLVVAALPALLGLALHAPIWALVRWNARRSMQVRTDYAAKAILPGLHLIFLSYLLLGGLFALGFRAVGWSSGWAVPALMMLPRLGDLGLWWRDGVRGLVLRARVARWSSAERAALHAAAEQLRAAWLADAWLADACSADASSTVS
jgi:1-acyl-sn-glycerol-3-phosphate acyltransferase